MQYLGIDVGGSAIKYAVMDEAFGIASQGSREGRPESHQEFLDIVAALYEQAGRPAGGVAISYCGEVDELTGQILTSGSHKYNIDTNLKTDLEPLLGCRVSVENDGNCAALAELAAGSLRGCKNAMVIVVGTGLGGGIILDGKVYHGSHKFSGGLSLLASTLDADLANNHGYTDAPVIGKALCAAALHQGYVLARGEDPAANMPTNGKEFFALVETGDEVAKRVLTGYARSFATLVYNLQQVLDLEAVAVGGGVSAAPAFGKALRAELDRLYGGTYATRLGVIKPQLFICERRNDANLIGALAHHINQAK